MRTVLLFDRLFVCVDRISCPSSVLAEIHRGAWGEAPAVQKRVQERDRQGHRAQRRGTGSVVAGVDPPAVQCGTSDFTRCALLYELGYVQKLRSMFSRVFFGIDQARDDRSHLGFYLFSLEQDLYI